MDKMVVMPLPRLDLLADEKYVGDVKRRIKERYPRLGSAGRKTIVYAPTFRKEAADLKKKNSGWLRSGLQKQWTMSDMTW